MMKEILKKSLIILIIMLFCLITLFNMNEVNAGSYEEAMKTALQGTEEDKTTGASEAVTNITGTIISVARIVGICVAITMLLAIAMKYMVAAPGEKADIKKSAIVYVVGAIILFAVVGILGIIEQFSTVIS